MDIRPDITISLLRREINFINDIPDGSRKIGEIHINRANYRNFKSDNENCLKRLFAKYWSHSLLGHLRKLDSLVVLTDKDREAWTELNNVVTIPNPLPFTPTKSSLQTEKRVIAIARYSYEKGYDLLLRVWSIVEKKCTDWQLDIFAMGDPTPYVKLMDELSIDKHRCHLNSSLVDVEREYQRSSILVQPSRTEGFGLVLVEAMACGLPVVAFDCENGPRSLITDGEDGFLIPAYDIGKFSERLMSLMNDEKLRKEMGERSLAKSQKYQISKIAQQWKQLFEELVV
jgi:glycosyltransferase involved in cell wall biosynthesis